MKSSTNLRYQAAGFDYEVMKDTAKQQAQAQLESIMEMVTTLHTAVDDDQREKAQTTIYEDPLSVQVRSGWHEPGERAVEPSEFMILLCTGGPAVRLIGELNQYGEPDEARIEYQDWFTPWETLFDVSDDESAALLEYCRQFLFAIA
jgi:hypothetical protein